MFYPNLKFPKRTGRPFFYTNFVQTVDGKVQVKKEGYWPIGSKVDYQVLMELRAEADALVHGKNLAMRFARATLNSLEKPSFKKMRKNLDKNPNLPYYVVTHHPKAFLASQTWSGSVKKLSWHLHKMGYKNVLVEGGPILLGAFLKENLIDEIFLTIAPKIFGNAKDNTLTLVEGYLFPPKAIKKLLLLSHKQINDELYLRYRVIS